LTFNRKDFRTLPEIPEVVKKIIIALLQKTNFSNSGGLNNHSKGNYLYVKIEIRIFKRRTK